MPYKVTKDEVANARRPFAVTRDDGQVLARHATEKDAKEQAKGLDEREKRGAA